LLAVSGNADASTLAVVTDGDGNAAMDPPYDSPLSGATGTTTASGEIRGTGLAWVGPPIADEKAATALDFVADYLFRDETGIVTRQLGASNSDAYVGGQFITLHDPGVMIVTIGGNDGKTAAQTVLGALSKLTTPMDPQTFGAAREAFLYHIASDTQNPQEMADNLGWYAVEGKPLYAPGDSGGEYARNARALDPQYVSDVVRKYLSTPVTVQLITVTPKGPAS
jgi:predicted Zn-dependent peptidase